MEPKKAILPTLTRGADALVQKWTDTWDQSSKSYLVPYYFMSSYPEEYKEPIRTALEEFERSTCIHFLEITEAAASAWPAKILVHRGEDGPEQLEGCWSHLGKEETTQLLSLSGKIKVQFPHVTEFKPAASAQRRFTTNSYTLLAFGTNSSVQIEMNSSTFMRIDLAVLMPVAMPIMTQSR